MLKKLRLFDIGGTGCKTGLVTFSVLELFLSSHNSTENQVKQRGSKITWVEEPHSLGLAPGQSGFADWLLRSLPCLHAELADPHVAFGVSVAGRLNHSTGTIATWYGGGHPSITSAGESPKLVSEIMGLPHTRTYAIHDGSAHLLVCSRGEPMPGLASFALGTGVGFGLTDGSGAILDRSSPKDAPHLLLGGLPVSGAPYGGIFRSWLRTATELGFEDLTSEVMSRRFSDVDLPWRTPWVSLVLGSSGLDLAKATRGIRNNARLDRDGTGQCLSGVSCDLPNRVLRNPSELSSSKTDAGVEGRNAEAVRTFSEQWLHFLHSVFLPDFNARSDQFYHIREICFAGGVVEHNWNLMQDVLVNSTSGFLKRAFVKGDMNDTVHVLPPAPNASGLVGAGIYSFLRTLGVASIWSQ